MSPGTMVRLLGKVSVPSGAFVSSTPYGFALQDDTAGIYVVDKRYPARGSFQIGEIVAVTGTTQTVNGMVAIDLIEAKKIGKGKDVTPNFVPTGQVGKANEGLILGVAGRVDSLKNDMPYGYKLFINDGTGALTVFLNSNPELIELVATLEIKDSISVIGLSASYNGINEIEPRHAKDFRILSK